MNRLLAPTAVLLAVILLAVNVPALAVDRTFQIEVENSLKGTVPSNWWLHASWRDQTLVVFVSLPFTPSRSLCPIAPYLAAFFRFPRHNAAADYECGHDGNKNPELRLLHRGVLRRLTPPRAVLERACASSLAL